MNLGLERLTDRDFLATRSPAELQTIVLRLFEKKAEIDAVISSIMGECDRRDQEAAKRTSPIKDRTEPRTFDPSQPEQHYSID